MANLFDIPVEIRNKIYKLHFLAITLTSTGRITDESFESNSDASSLPEDTNTGLALLRTCKTIHGEVKKVWSETVLFEFDSTRKMLNGLATLGIEDQGKVRHVYVKGRPLKLQLRFGRCTEIGFDDEDVIRYGLINPTTHLGAILGLIPGLSLDTLTVDCRGLEMSPTETYQAVDSFFELPGGWKELRFLAATLKVLAWSPGSLIWSPDREAQPVAWNEALTNSDGYHSDASVKIYRAKQPQVRDAVLDEGSRDEYQQEVDSDAEDYIVYKKDEYLLTAQEADKELLVVAQAGGTADIRTHPDNVPDVMQAISDTYDDAEFEEKPLTWSLITEAESLYKHVKREMRRRGQDADYDEHSWRSRICRMTCCQCWRPRDWDHGIG